MHLFLYGESGAGKSYSIRRALHALHISPKGFCTQKNGEGQLEFHYGEETVIVADDRSGMLGGIPQAFDRAGVAALANVCAGDVVLMDELGDLEKDASLFQQAVLRTLQKPCRAIGVIKDTDTPFMRAIRQTRGVRAMPICEHTRADMYRIVRDYMRPRGLCEALGVGIGMTAVIGGGGKTSLCLALAKELSKEDKVIFTTTTHIAFPEGMPHATREEEIAPLLERANAISVCAPLAEDPMRFQAPEASMHALLSHCDCLLVEADGSKGLPLKAHAAHEPAIPDGARVLCVIGADAFGKPIEEVVHRPALFAAAVDARKTDIVTPRMAAKAAARADTVFINKVETAEALEAGRAFAACRPHKRTVLGSLRSERPVIEIWEGDLCVW
ncbi:MAG: selenium cofactor biosynthesis protein YqeC [Eubacteriales bacterium]|nr:selenium cofactor biosynthesis protein YqeC [Eubacteriales bacterium]